ncbi:MAG: Rieske 2Fe-2S domain-containing protein, partial [Rhodococcus sp. (in: high G+C Gram-positive bacteria)]|uniref:aromatic ring-hydroxylating oxygenase subunit alpha n=1 Tax=Rhodococcus sp. TaxID=1831 RepID=UPI003BAE962C
MTVTDDPTTRLPAESGPFLDEDPEAHRFRVHRSTMTSPEIYATEMERVFAHSWLYVGHESEIRKKGDYVRRPVGGRQVFMVRGREGQVNVFHNTCTHRGAMVCRAERGNAKIFSCFYHAWSFNTDGELVGIPDKQAYGDDLDFGKLGLRSAARVDSYRGFVFLSYDPDIVPLVDYLAGATEYLDLIVDAVDDAEVISGTNEYAINANWKLLVENSIDGYHAVSTHDTYFKYLAALGTDLAGGVKGTAKSLGNGHAVLEYKAPWGRPVAKWEPLFGEGAREEIGRLRDELVSK